MKRTCAAIVLLATVFLGQGYALDIEFLPQVPPGSWGPTTKNCGPTSVIMVAAYQLGFTPTANDIQRVNNWLVTKGMWPDTNSGNGYNTSINQLQVLAQEFYGFQNIEIHRSNDISWIRQQISVNSPVIVGVRLDMTTTLSGHFMVITDINDTTVTVNDPGHSTSNPNYHRTYTHQQFIASWATQGYVAMVIRPQVGFFPTGWYSGISDSFLTAYNQQGGYAGLGSPNAKHGMTEVHSWNGETIQTFVQHFGQRLESALIYNQSRQTTYLVQGDFWSAYQQLKLLEQKDIADRNTSGRYRIGTPVGNAYDAASCTPTACRRQDFSDGYLYLQPSGQVLAYTTCGGQSNWSFGGLSIAGNSRAVVNPGVPNAPTVETTTWYCTFWDQLSNTARAKYWSGMLYNGGNELCGSFGWKGYSVRDDPRAYRCQQTDRTGCIFELAGRGSSVWDSHQTNDKSFPINLTKGTVYRFSGWFRTRETPGGQRPVRVALTPRKSYDANGSIAAVTDLLAEPLSITATDSWQLFTHTFVARRENSMAALRIFSGGSTGWLQMDDLKLEAVPRSAWPEDGLWPLSTSSGEEAALYHPTLARSFRLSPPFWEAYQDLAEAPGDPRSHLTEVGQCGTWDYCLEQPFDTGVLHWDPRQPDRITWVVSGTVRATLFPDSAVVPDHTYTTPVMEFSGAGTAWQLRLYFGLNSSGRLIGFNYGSPYPSEIREVVVTMDNIGTVAVVPFNINGVTVPLPSNLVGTPCSFYLRGSSNYSVNSTGWKVENGDYIYGHFVWGPDYY